ncbi:hypothetical protein [Fredinandcohnia sp. 179-A 10B2 NHS]|uniref:hypothetical protein n=1 Tax=Fredinandcohnia sp. 179-A 10B2 NHS TaxID=3235176 RepID=UPI0039A0C2D4
MYFNFLELLGAFTVFYIFRFFLDSKYEVRKKKMIAIDILITTVFAFIVQWVIGVIF